MHNPSFMALALIISEKMISTQKINKRLGRRRRDDDTGKAKRMSHFFADGTKTTGNSIRKSRKENPQKLTQLSSRSHPRHLVGKRTAQKDITIDTTSDSQVNSNFPNRWSPASLTFNNYFHLFLYLYIT